MRRPKNAGDNADTEAAAEREYVCPHLGVEENRYIFCREPSPRHRCYLWMQRDRIDLSHQANFCLTDAHSICPWLSVGAPLSAQLESRTLPLRRAALAAAVPLARRAAALASAFRIWLLAALAGLARLAARLAAVLWRRLRPALGESGRYLASQARRGLVALARLALRLGGQAVESVRGPAARASSELRRQLEGRRDGTAGREGDLSLHQLAEEAEGGPAGGTERPSPPVAPAEPESAPDATPGVGKAPPIYLPVNAEPERTAEGAPAAAELVEQGILAMREGSRDRDAAYAAFVRASELDPSFEQAWLWRAALSESIAEKRQCLEQILRVNPASTSARSALELLDQPVPPSAAKPAPGTAPAASTPAARLAPAASTPAAVSEPLSRVRPPVRPARILWQCDACETINTGPIRVCRACGRPSPQVEEELMSSGDTLLEQGLAGLKSGNEELAYGYFVMACKASPKSELAWSWRAKTAPTLDEVIHCLEKLLEINPKNAKVQADLKSALERRQREEALPRALAPGRSSEAGGEARVAAHLARVVGGLRWVTLQLAALCAFALGLSLTIPYALGLSDTPPRPELERYLALLPRVELPELAVNTSNLPGFELGPVLPLVLGLLLLHAAFAIADNGGPAGRVWAALLGAAAGGMIWLYGTNGTASWLVVLAAVEVVAALAGKGRESRPAYGPTGREVLW